MEGDHQDLSCDAVLLSDEENETAGDLQESESFWHGRGNQPTCGTYSFLNQLFSLSDRREYNRKITLINECKYIDKKEIGDVLMLCSREDIKGAGDYCEYLKTLQMRGGPGQPGVNVKASLMEEEVLPGQPDISRSVDAFERFTFVFLYVTKHSHKDKKNSYLQDVCLQQGIEKKQKQGCIVVIYADEVDIPLKFKTLSSARASDRSKDTQNALIKKLERKLDVREAKEKEFVEKIIEIAEEFEKKNEIAHFESLKECNLALLFITWE